ncbi:trehalose-phosphatase [Neomicrococcus aestuarii]|uniref:Trehalose 6-phosphate phosphatase n=1 Tax=Neomicrococcus aestuarii TaxID=556325 RepID=A0A1L2ZNL7_9MICC|nr:trehalose-phosphatase [Neomicrococcus aestuarii]APF40638.1 trehalose-phosphatase [Neomicrococcus aestuarii]
MSRVVVPENFRRESELGARLQNAERLLIALDFDGTISPLVARPEDARALPATARLLRKLDELAAATVASARPTFLALVSGRDIASLQVVAEPGEHSFLVGSHGAELRTPVTANLDPAVPLTEAQRELLATVTEVLESVQSKSPGSFLEYKTLSTVLHTRGMGTEEASGAVVMAEKALASLNGVSLNGVSLKHGKEILEAAVAHSSKGEGLIWLREQTGADCLLFAGDDVTDEQGFAALKAGQDVTVKVGSGETIAEFRIYGPESLPALLQLVLDVRS